MLNNVLITNKIVELCNDSLPPKLTQNQFQVDLQYPNADTICLLCDGGGANSCLHHIFKQELMELAKEIGIS